MVLRNAGPDGQGLPHGGVTIHGRIAESQPSSPDLDLVGTCQLSVSIALLLTQGIIVVLFDVLGEVLARRRASLRRLCAGVPVNVPCGRLQGRVDGQSA